MRFVYFIVVSSAAFTICSDLGVIDKIIDDDTPARSIRRFRDGSILNLVMSDEFNEENRSFEPGKDSIFEARNIPDSTNGAIEFCNSFIYNKYIYISNTIL